MQLWQNPYAELMQNYADIFRKNKKKQKTEKKQKPASLCRTLQHLRRTMQNYAELMRTFGVWCSKVSLCAKIKLRPACCKAVEFLGCFLFFLAVQPGYPDLKTQMIYRKES
jgi:hypothetical protein